MNIVIQGTNTGAVTDVDGNFTINVPGPDAVLVFSSIGYHTKSITVGDQTTISQQIAVSGLKILGDSRKIATLESGEKQYFAIGVNDEEIQLIMLCNEGKH